MASPGNQHCANWIDALSFPVGQSFVVKMDERVWTEMKSECREEAERWWGYADIKVDYAVNSYTYITSIPSPLAGFMTHDSRHLQADCQKPGSAPEPYAR